MRVEGALDGVVEVERRGLPLAGQLAALDPADAVLAADRATERHRQREQLLRRGLRALSACASPRLDQERRVEVAVPGVAPAAGLETVAAADLDDRRDRLPQPLERNDDVLAELAPAPRA